MIDRLPLEVLLHCLSYVSKKDQIECLLVKRSTCNAIQASGVIYQFITITTSDDFADMHAFFAKHKELCKLVKKLHISEIALDVYTYMTLPALLPNIKEFSYINTNRPQRDYDDKEVCEAFKPWAGTLDSLQEFGSPVAAFSLLAHVACPQLKNLSLSLVGMDGEDLKFALYDYLKNCPKVKQLDLKFINATLEHMEQLHAHLPNLEVLSLTQVGLPLGKYQGTPKHAKKMKTLFLDEFICLDDLNQWLGYMSKKYPNLKNLIIGKAEDMNSDPIVYSDTNGLVKLIKQVPKLELYSNSCFKLTPAIVKALDSTGIQLKKIELAYFAQESFKLLIKSQQIHSLTSLTISDISYGGMAYNREKKFLKELGSIKHLKHLRINQSKEEVDGPVDNRVPLDDLLAAVPSLESLQMDFFTLVISRDTGEAFDTKLNKLVLEECYLDALALKGQDNRKERSKELLQQLLPNTDIEYRELGDTPPFEEYNHLLKLK
ncbi:hypothetical protein MAM1_0276d09119 [Mucor ambiguus]|uniref:F-box domain-containing protein n=1 Tax=Mucor ambiguus TaxID=91626 RepID=A0A0C9MQ67_9FUNG|nr:hypothetical protein MAM1_0276d09119 [Mucor ambiguus]